MDEFPHSEQPAPPAETDPTASPRLPLRRGPEDEAVEARPTLWERVERARAAFARAKTVVQQKRAAAMENRAARMQELTAAAETPHPPRQPRTPAQRKRILRVIEAALVLVAIFLGLALFFTLRLRHSMRAALPALDGTVQVSGLHAPVTITRDTQGVPSIAAASLDDLLFAQGYITAGDRLFQMDALRRHAAGELAELLGPSMVDHDRQQRTLQLRSAADNAVAAMPAEQRAQFAAYARGVNAYIDSHRTALPVEFSLLHYTPAPWQPRDSVLVMLAMWQDLATTFPHKLARESLMTHLPADLAADLYPVGSFRDHPPSAPPADLSAPVEEIEQIPLDSTQSSLLPHDLLDRTHALGLDLCSNCRAGSNNWAVAGSRSASGAPLLSNDMHLGLSVPDIWYEAALHVRSSSDPVDVSGFTLPGIPFVIVGRNAHVAWGFTNLGGDVQDVYIEHVRGSGESLEFQRADGTWLPAQHHHERIRVRFGHDVTLDVVTTEHAVGTKMLRTPIITPLFRSEHRMLSLAWTAYDPAALMMPLQALNTARDGASLTASLVTFGGPSLNLVYADDAGHIGYHAVGFIPIRGPADHHPRAMPQLVLPTDVPPDEDSSPDASPGASSEPDASLASPGGAVLQLAAFAPPQRRRRPSAVHIDTQSAAKQTTPHVEPEAASSETTIAPEPKVLDYTVGSPISPVPVDALDRSQAWSGYVPYEELPSVVDPPGGVIATANSRVTPDDYTYAIADEWMPPYRTERIRHLLDGRTGLTPADMLAVQTDVHSSIDRFLAERLAYAIDHANAKLLHSDAKRLASAADILRRWRGDVTPDAAAPSIISAVRHTLLRQMIASQIRQHDGLSAHSPRADDLAELYLWVNESTALEMLLNHEPPRWLPPGFANWNDFLAATLEDTLRSASAPRDLPRWTWGSLHTSAEIHHPIFAPATHVSRLLGVATNPPSVALPGDTTTVNSIGVGFGPSERFTADLRSPDATTANITTGESGNPASPYYLDQFAHWAAGTTFALLLQPAGAHTLTLVP